MGDGGLRRAGDYDERISHELRRVLRAGHEASLAVARRLGLGLNDVAALDLLGLHGPQGAAQIARRLGMRPASATLLIDRLEQAGHVRRRRDGSDRRRITVVPTAQAARDAIGAMEPMLAGIDAVVRDLDPSERETVERFLGRVADALDAYADDTPH